MSKLISAFKFLTPDEFVFVVAVFIACIASLFTQ